VPGVNVDTGTDRLALDPELWQRADMRRALARRDLATVFTLLRRVGTSQRMIATLTGLAPSEVYEISRGRRVMAYDVLCRIADGLGVPRGYLGLAYDSETASFVGAADGRGTGRTDLDEVAALLAHAAEVAVGMDAGPAALRWTAPHEAGTPVPRRLSRGDADQIEAITCALRGLDYGLGGGACREAVVAQTRWVHQLLHADAADDVRHRLVLASADLDNLAGWTSFDVGLFGAARGYFARALTQARRAGDASLIANVLYRAGRLHLHQGLTREALRFFQLGKLAATECSCNLTVAMLSANEAWAYGILGDVPRARAALAHAEEEFARASGPVAPWVSFFGPTDLEALAGMTHLELGAYERSRLTRARASLTAALEARGSDMARSRSFELTALAIAVLHDGENVAGLALGEEAVDLAERVRSVRVLDRLRPLGRAAVETGVRGGRELAERIRLAAAG
jgi:transcriptional regulator with XRE-family HTH domain/tetratricopeptide (TPR) repeat protein